MDDPRELTARRTPEMVAVLAIVVACVGALAFAHFRPGDEPAPPEACAEILRRYADARMRQADPRPTASALAAQRAAAQRRAERSPRFERCPRAMRARDAECALAAGDADQIERCLQ
jgi:hypothetical protein